ncbi:hypothetical protein N0V91_006999 [Didymella pomorum]|uniref:Ras modification protein ERF4 n=1 Tax=Didymella pomorum TaxID=749634 RepID=A0A9W8ZCB3_9PLEO|nr:hypothetical protein N0V91_006999 [Didymella pomorum]
MAQLPQLTWCSSPPANPVCRLRPSLPPVRTIAAHAARTGRFAPTTVTITSHTPQPATAPPNATATEAPTERDAPPQRWSLTNRIFSLSLRGLYPAAASAGPPRQPASRLWNPQNSSPRPPPTASSRSQQQHPPPSAPREPNVPVERPRSERDEYPLLTLPQRRQSRQSPATSSLFVERSTAPDDINRSGRTSIGLPRDQARGRTSLQHDYESRSPTPGPSMAVVHNPPPPSAPQHHDTLDVEAGKRAPPQSSGGRVSLPGSGRTSLSRSRSNRTNGDGDDASEFPWGPSHPCFPHPNPHVPLNSELYETTKIIRIKRDWMVKGDLAPTFANLYPEILDPLITEDDFRDVVKKINDSLVAAFDPFTFRAWLDAVMGVATFWLWDDVGMSGVKKQLNELESWIDRWNKKVGEKEAVKIIPLRRTGYLTLDIQIPDPHLGPDNGTMSRPDTREDEFGHNIRQKNEDYGNYTIPTPTLQVNSMPPAIESQS